MKKILLGLSSLLIILTMQAKIEVVQASEEPSLYESIIAQEGEQSNNDLDLNIKLSDTENRLVNAIKIKYNLGNIDLNGSFYLSLLNDLAMSQNEIIPSEDTEQVEFSEFATIYVNRIASQIPVDPTQEELDVIEESRNALLNRTYQDIKVENMNSLAIAQSNTQLSPRARRSAGSFNVWAASQYAQKYSLKPNTTYRYFSNGDCTNFASQIALAAGKQYDYYQNASGMPWYYTNSFSYSKPWTLAHQFLVYWSAEGSRVFTCTTKAQVQSNAIEGDFIAYMKKNTYEIGHISYVNAKRSGKISVSQHSTNRYDYSFDTQDTSAYSSFMVLRIR